MRLLVTGGAGFIGSHICEALLSRGDMVAIIDDLNDFYSPAEKIANLDLLRAKQPPIQFYKTNITDQIRVNEVVAEARPEIIVHLAARSGVRDSVEQPLLYQQVNIGGTTVLLEAARRYGIRKVIFSSSSSVYGESKLIPFSEENTDTWPISPYAVTKLGAEKLCFTYSRLYGLSVVCLRLFNVYGPRQRPDLAVRKLTDMILRKQSIPIFGDGSAARDYTFVGDIVAGVLAAIDYDCRFELFNLGNSKPVLVREVITNLESLLGLRAEVQLLPPQLGDVPITYADITKAARLLGYCPRTEFMAGLKAFVDWHRRA